MTIFAVFPTFSVMARLVRAIHVEPLPEQLKKRVNGQRHKINAMLLHSLEIAFNTLPDSSGLVPGIHVFTVAASQVVDGRNKCGHDVDNGWQ